MTAPAILWALSANYALAQQVEFTDPEILPEYFAYDSPHGFQNDSTPSCDEEAAELAWSRRPDWLRKHLA
jgi:dienelactone hydrolase